MWFQGLGLAQYTIYQMLIHLVKRCVRRSFAI